MDPWTFTILGYKARVLHPEYALLAVGVAAASVLLVLALVRRVGRVGQVVPDRLRQKVLPGFSPARLGTRLGLSLGGVLLCTLALTQPQCGTGTELARKVGIDVVVALDVSRSMLARDVTPSRLERARLELTDLIDRLDGDRFGLVVFAGTAFVQCPMTTDYSAAKLFLRAVDSEQMPTQGTDIALALRMAERLLGSREGARSKVIVLLTDGEDHSGAAIEVAEALAEQGVKIYAVGIGSPAGEPIPVVSKHGDVVGYKKDPGGNTVLSRLDEKTLEEIASVTGGAYVAAGTTGAGVEQVIERIDELEKDEFESRMTTRFEDRSVLLILPGFLLLLAGAVVRPGGRRPRVQREQRQRSASGPSRAAAALLLLLSPALTGMRLLESEHPLVEQGNEAYATGKYDDALASYEAALAEEKDPGNRARIDYNRGTTFAAKGDIEAARGAFQQALAGADDSLKARDFYNLGTALLRSGDPEGAAQSLIRSLRIDKDNPSARYNLELALRQMKQQQEQEQQQSSQGEDSEEQEQQDEQQQQDASSEQQEDQEEGESDPEQEDAGQDQADQKEQGQEGDSQEESGQDSASEQSQEGDEQQGEEQQSDSQDGEEQQGDEQQESSSEAGDEQREGEESEGERESEQERTQEEGERASEPGEQRSEEERRAEEARELQAGARGTPSDAQEMAAVPAEVGEQEAEEILDALERGEKPLQMQIFMLKEYDEKHGSAGGPDW